MCWPIEQLFKIGKNELGMDEYELRSWRGWHCHMLFVFLAMLFLIEVQQKFKKNSSFDLASSQKINNRSFKS